MQTLPCFYFLIKNNKRQVCASVVCMLSMSSAEVRSNSCIISKARELMFFCVTCVDRNKRFRASQCSFFNEASRTKMPGSSRTSVCRFLLTSWDVSTVPVSRPHLVINSTQRPTCYIRLQSNDRRKRRCLTFVI